jgi:sarcosine oxidase subunit alpha
MCSENGFLMDDGVVARLDEETFLCHTTTGGADRIHGWMEDWLQCEWWDWKVYTANVTEQWAQVAVVGPKAREVLQALGGDMDLSKDALPFMGWAEGKLGAFDARVFRISFSGELSFEVAVPASQGLAFWDALMAARGRARHHALRHRGAARDAGREGLHHDRGRDRRHGDPAGPRPPLGDLEEEGRFLGKRAQERTHMTDPERWQAGGARDARRLGPARRRLCLAEGRTPTASATPKAA